MIRRILPSMVTALFVVSMVPASTWGVTLSVPGTSDPWLAGMPDGSTASISDVAPAQSPVFVPGLNLGVGGFLTFTAAGAVSIGSCCALQGPDGGSSLSHATGAENGIADLTAPFAALVGVFSDNTQPNTAPAPPPLDFTSIGTSFASFAPELKQAFFIGDGLTATGSGTAQTFVIPAGATRLFLGTMDGYEWSNNPGAFDVTVNAVPEPSTLLLCICGLAVLGTINHSRTQRRSLTG